MKKFISLVFFILVLFLIFVGGCHQQSSKEKEQNKETNSIEEDSTTLSEEDLSKDPILSLLGEKIEMILESFGDPDIRTEAIGEESLLFLEQRFSITFNNDGVANFITLLSEAKILDVEIGKTNLNEVESILGIPPKLQKEEEILFYFSSFKGGALEIYFYASPEGDINGGTIHHIK